MAAGHPVQQIINFIRVSSLPSLASLHSHIAPSRLQRTQVERLAAPHVVHRTRAVRRHRRRRRHARQLRVPHQPERARLRRDQLERLPPQPAAVVAADQLHARRPVRRAVALARVHLELQLAVAQLQRKVHAHDRLLAGGRVAGGHLGGAGAALVHGAAHVQLEKVIGVGAAGAAAQAGHFVRERRAQSGQVERVIVDGLADGAVR